MNIVMKHNKNCRDLQDILRSRHSSWPITCVDEEDLPYSRSRGLREERTPVGAGVGVIVVRGFNNGGCDDGGRWREGRRRAALRSPKGGDSPPRLLLLENVADRFSQSSNPHNIPQRSPQHHSTTPLGRYMLLSLPTSLIPLRLHCILTRSPLWTWWFFLPMWIFLWNHEWRPQSHPLHRLRKKKHWPLA